MPIQHNPAISIMFNNFRESNTSTNIWLSCLLLFISFCLMFLKEDIEELEEFEHLEHEEALKK